MSADDSADPGRQRTVAELLAQHGGGKPGGSSRRRRRAAEDDDEPASPSTRTGAAEATGRDRPASRDTSTTRNRRVASPADAPPGGTSAQPVAPQVPEQRWAGPTGYGQSIDPLTGEPIDPLSGRTYRSMPSTRTDPPTEEMPLYPERGWASRAKEGGPLTGPITGPMAGGSGRTGSATPGGGVAPGPATGQVSRAELFGEPHDGHDDLDDRDDDLDDDRDDDVADLDADAAWGRRATAAPAGLAERGEHGELAEEEGFEHDERVVGWFGLLVQWVVGAVAGALLWVGFSYLWMHVPVVALIAAVLATAVLVLVVRAIRRSDDLQTTMLAVLVGLVVTISPAVLLLAVR